jgi:iron complex outermembrane recepter protein
MKKIIIYICLSVISFAAIAQGNQLKGKVYDAYSNKPLAGATVQVTGNGGATTDNDGMFTIQCSDGMEITVSFVGYETDKETIGKCKGELNIGLKPSSSNLHEIEISTSKIEATQTLKEAQSISVLTTDDMNRASGLNLQDVLNNVPGVDMQNREPFGGDRIIIRGYMPNLGNSVNTSNGFGYMAYINNIPITDATGNTILDDIDMSSLGRVEVIKGPASPLFGSFIGGSVNLYTPTPTQSGVQEQAIGGSYGLFRTNTTITEASDNSSIWINYGHQTYGGFRPNDFSRKDFASFGGDFKTSSKNTISTYFSYNNSDEQLAGELDSFQVYSRQTVSDSNYMLNNSRVKIESYRGGVTDNYKFDNHFSNQTTLFTAAHDLDQAIAHGFTDYSVVSFGGRTAFMYDCHGDNISLNGILGGSFQKTAESINGVFILPFHLPPFTTSTPIASYTDQQNYAMNYNIFTQWSLKLPAQITVTAGGSMNFAEFGIQNMLTSSHLLYNEPNTYVNVFTPAFTPSGSIIKVINTNMSVYGSVGMGYTPPGLSQILTSAGQVTSGLKPESAMQYEIGTKGNIANSNFTYQLSLYDLDITNRLITEYANAISSTTNAGEQRNTGAELYLAYNLINNKNNALSLLRLWVSYTYDNAVYVNFVSYGKSAEGTDTLLATYSNNKVAAVAPNMINAGIDFDTKSGFYAHATFKYMDKVPITFDNVDYMSSYNLLGAKIGFKHTFGHFVIDVFAGADNLLNSTYYSSIFIGGSIGPLAQGTDPNIKGGSGDGYILPAPYNATFYGGATLRYNF